MITLLKTKTVDYEVRMTYAEFVKNELKQIIQYDKGGDYYFYTSCSSDGFLKKLFTLPEDLFSMDITNFNCMKKDSVMQHIIDILEQEEPV